MGLTQTYGHLSKNAKIFNHSASLVWCYLIHGNKTRKNKHWNNPSVPSVFAIFIQKREPSSCRGREMKDCEKPQTFEVTWWKVQLKMHIIERKHAIFHDSTCSHDSSFSQRNRWTFHIANMLVSWWTFHPARVRLNTIQQLKLFCVVVFRS